jgi:hypothetical protein
MQAVTAASSTRSVMHYFLKFVVCMLFAGGIVYGILAAAFENPSFAALLVGGGFLPLIVVVPVALPQSWKKARAKIEEPREQIYRTVNRVKRLATSIAVSVVVVAAIVRPESWTAWAAAFAIGGSFLALGLALKQIESDVRSEYDSQSH